MKLKSILSIALGFVLSLNLASCGDDNDTISGTDASKDFAEEMTFTGKLEPLNSSDANLPYLTNDLMTVTLKKYEVENVQAVTIRYTGKCIKKEKDKKTEAYKYTDVNVDFTHVFNVAKAGNSYVFTSASTGGERATCGRLVGSQLILNMKLISSGKISAATASKDYTFTGTKQDVAE